jgi:hypothetical protein
MNTCNGENCEHDYIVYEGKTCALCQATILINDLNKEIAKLRRENTQMDNQLAMCQDACEVCPSRFECVTTKKAQ